MDTGEKNLPMTEKEASTASGPILKISTVSVFKEKEVYAETLYLVFSSTRHPKHLKTNCA
jgi:hypothetical protein